MSKQLFHSQHIALPQGKIEAIRNTHQSGNPVILAIHGWLDNAASFIPLIEQLPQYNWTAIDLPGHGFSFHRPQHSYYHFVDWVSDLVTLIRQEYNQKVILVGHSLGGMLSTVIAGLYPELVEKLVLIDAAGLVIQSEHDCAVQLRQALDSRNINVKQTKQFSLDKAVNARVNAGDISFNSAKLLVNRNVIKISEQDNEQDSEQNLEQWQWASDKRLKSRSPLRLSQSQAQDIIENITAPTLMCLADQGDQYMKTNFDLFSPCYKNLITANVKGHHHCHMDNALEVSQVIKSFID